MNKTEIDQLYHLLRQSSNIAEEAKINTTTCLTPSEQINVLYGLCRHLLAGGDYLALIKFSEYYGLWFLLEPTFETIQKAGWKPRRIVEFGAGLGWLGRGLAARFGLLPLLSIDKRPWSMIDIVEDLETEEGRQIVLDELKDGDLIVACDFLHCLDFPIEVMHDFQKWPTVILEYYPVKKEYRDSYSTQIGRYGAQPLFSEEVVGHTFPGRTISATVIDPYVLWLISPTK